MVLTSDGEILTNNHVVNGATSITVTIVSTGKSYRADVVGTDPTDDVAVIQLRNASGLKKANLGDSDDVKVGDSIVGVGNAGGTGTLRASNGKVDRAQPEHHRHRRERFERREAARLDRHRRRHRRG